MKKLIKLYEDTFSDTVYVVLIPKTLDNFDIYNTPQGLGKMVVPYSREDFNKYNRTINEMIYGIYVDKDKAIKDAKEILKQIEDIMYLSIDELKLYNNDLEKMYRYQLSYMINMKIIQTKHKDDRIYVGDFP